MENKVIDINDTKIDELNECVLLMANQVEDSIDNECRTIAEDEGMQRYIPIIVLRSLSVCVSTYLHQYSAGKKDLFDKGIKNLCEDAENVFEILHGGDDGIQQRRTENPL